LRTYLERCGHTVLVLYPADDSEENSESEAEWRPREQQEKLRLLYTPPSAQSLASSPGTPLASVRAAVVPGAPRIATVRMISSASAAQSPVIVVNGASPVASYSGAAVGREATSPAAAVLRPTADSVPRAGAASDAANDSPSGSALAEAGVLVETNGDPI